MGKRDPATRRVSNLSSSQIERKRAMDRTNQQQFQRKRKARIEWLERENAHLAERLQDAELMLQRHREAGCFRIDGCDRATMHPTTAANADILPRNFAAPATNGRVGDVSKTFGTGRARQHDDAFVVRIEDVLRADANTGSETAFGLDNLILPYSMSLAGNNAQQMPEWLMLPLHVHPTTDLENVIFETTRMGQCVTHELNQPQFPSISSLLNPSLDDDGMNPLTSALAKHIVRKSAIQSLTTRVAFMYLMSSFLRWLVCRTKESYDQLPDFIKPTHLQRTCPHPAWVDMITWPEARDDIIRRNRWQSIDFAYFRQTTGATMSVNWPYTDSGVFLDLGEDGQRLVLSPIFESHIRDVNNWTLGMATAKIFPFMRGFCRPASGN